MHSTSWWWWEFAFTTRASPPPHLLASSLGCFAAALLFLVANRGPRGHAHKHTHEVDDREILVLPSCSGIAVVVCTAPRTPAPRRPRLSGQGTYHIAWQGMPSRRKLPARTSASRNGAIGHYSTRLDRPTCAHEPIDSALRNVRSCGQSGIDDATTAVFAIGLIRSSRPPSVRPFVNLQGKRRSGRKNR